MTQGHADDDDDGDDDNEAELTLYSPTRRDTMRQ